MMVAEAFEKVRVNPGNFVDGRKTFEQIDYEDPKQFEMERAHIEEVFTPLVLKCKELGTAMRIGTNHGSLSARILSFYGDTPAGVHGVGLSVLSVCLL
jgi:(E)-4-hydroxy-3-methylbut-2-enyl-diphosphate synthase